MQKAYKTRNLANSAELCQLVSMFSNAFNGLFHTAIEPEDGSWPTLPTWSNSQNRTKAYKTGNLANSAELGQLFSMFSGEFKDLFQTAIESEDRSWSTLPTASNSKTRTKAYKTGNLANSVELGQLFSMFACEFNDLFHVAIEPEDRSWSTLPTWSNSKTRTKAYKTGNLANFAILVNILRGS